MNKRETIEDILKIAKGTDLACFGKSWIIEKVMQDKNEPMFLLNGRKENSKQRKVREINLNKKIQEIKSYCVNKI